MWEYCEYNAQKYLPAPPVEFYIDMSQWVAEAILLASEDTLEIEELKV